MNKRSQRPRRAFTPEFRTEVVELCRKGDRSIGEVARDLDLTETSVRNWIRQAEINAGDRDGRTTAEREEMRALRKQLRVVTEERDILKRAVSFFAKETR